MPRMWLGCIEIQILQPKFIQERSIHRNKGIDNYVIIVYIHPNCIVINVRHSGLA